MTAAPGDDADLGLNLVFSAPASTSGLVANGGSSASSNNNGNNSKKPKRKNKYDRFREKGRLAKLGNEKQNQQQRGVGGAVDKREENKDDGGSSLAGIAAMLSGSRKDTKSTLSGAPIITESATAEDAILEADDTKTKVKSAGMRDADAEETASDSKITAQSSAPSTEDNKGDAKEKATLDNKLHVPEPTTLSSSTSIETVQQPALSPMEDTTVSSRRHRAQTSLTEEQQTEYYDEFHARPRDLDRSEGASKSIKVSSASDHIFGESIIADDERENGSDGEDMEEDGTVKEMLGKAGNTLSSKNEMETKPSAPITCPFQKLGLHSHLVSTLTSPTGNFRLTQPTIVQSRCVAALLPSKLKKKKNTKKKKDLNLFIQSETGSGKTLAYLLPILQHLAVDPNTQNVKRVDRQLGGTRTILLCPTRELATQTYTIANNLCQASFPWIVTGCLSGGEKRKSEKARLRKGISILIATPGRLLDHLSKTESLLSALKNKLEWLVLDEADRLLDAGLGGQVEQIVQHLRSNQPGAGLKRDGVTWRSVLVSATVTSDLEGLAKTILGTPDGWMWARGHAAVAASSGNGGQSENDEPAKSSSSNQANNNELDNAAPRQLAQLYMVVSAKLRLSSLVAFLSARAAKGERTVVFLSTCDSVDYHHALLTSMESILGDKDNDEDDPSSTESNEGIFGKTCPIYKLHGDIPHIKRQSTLKAFNNDNSSNQQSAILLASDVAARGLNFPSLDWIVQYDPPCETKDYVHRAGRSARAGQAGHALLFLLPSERQYVEVLQLRGLKEISALSLSATLLSAAEACRGVAREGEAKAGGNTRIDVRGEAFTSAIQNRFEQCVLQDDIDYKASIEKKFKGDPKQKRRVKKRDIIGPLLEGARKAFSAFVRAYPAKEKAVRHIFNARALHLGHIARSLALKETPKMVSKGNTNSNNKAGSNDTDGDDSKTTRDKSQAGGKGEKRKSRLAFGNKDTEEKDDGDVATMKDDERDRDLSLLGDAIGGERRLHANKKIKSSTGGGGGGKDMSTVGLFSVSGDGEDDE
mmetsp:Transcript_9968/g.17928  ORF Transcript_9968/g.17928 Transcript_9968/m.17928 type:complete len:1042 (+) Transcript_9968:61-3186(+)